LLLFASEFMFPEFRALGCYHAVGSDLWKKERSLLSKRLEA
jgi:hypothetical protein